MRFSKRLSEDRQGAAGAIIAIIVILAVVAVAAIAMVAYGMANQDNKDQDDKDLDGDGVADPIIGYIVVSGVAYFDNSALLGGYYQGMKSCSMTLQDNPPSLDIMGEMADMFAHSDKYQMKFTVTQPTTGTSWSPSAIGFDLTVGPGGHTDITKTPSGSYAVRYHGAYHLLVQLLSDEGGVMDEVSLDKVL